MAESHPNHPFTPYPTQKFKTVPFTIFRNAFTDEMMGDLSKALESQDADGKLPSGTKMEEGSNRWYQATVTKWRGQGVFFPLRKELKAF